MFLGNLAYPLLQEEGLVRVVRISFPEAVQDGMSLNEKNRQNVNY